MANAIVGREAELAVVERFLLDVPTGPAALVIDGRAGVGKTTLWLEAVRLAEGQALRLLRARPAESEAKLSYTALADLVGAAFDELRGSLRVVAAGALYRPKAPTTAIVAAPGKSIASARDLVGKRIAIDAHNTIAHIGLLKWLKRSGVSPDQVTFTEIPFAEMIGPLVRGTVDAAVLPEPFLSVATQRGARRIAPIFDAVCAQDCLITIWMARKDVDPNLVARFRNAIQAAAVWANLERNRRASGAIPGPVRGDRPGPAREDDADDVRAAAEAGVGAAVGRRVRGVRRDPELVLGARPREVIGR